eukprot:COSAG02_NODE_735_length_17872_cov_20.966860_14_plen_77_part_00
MRNSGGTTIWGVVRIYCGNAAIEPPPPRGLEYRIQNTVYHPLRLQLDLIWTQVKVGETQVLVCALATLDRWIALGE